jgi:hypothetical protein
MGYIKDDLVCQCKDDSKTWFEIHSYFQHPGENKVDAFPPAPTI